MSETKSRAAKPSRPAKDRRKPGIVLLPPKGKRNVKIGGTSGANAFTNEEGELVNPDGVKGGIKIGLGGARVPCNGKAQSLIASGWTVAPGWEDRLKQVEAWRRRQVDAKAKAEEQIAKETKEPGKRLAQRIADRKKAHAAAQKAELEKHLEPEE